MIKYLFILTLSFLTALISSVKFTKTYGGLENDSGQSVNQTLDGGYIIAGSTISYGAGSSDVWLIKTDANGNQVWNKTFGGSGDDGAFSVVETMDGGFIIVGRTKPYGAQYYFDIWLIKTDADGNKLWDKTFGGSDTDMGYSVQQTLDGGYIVTGYTESYGAGARDFWLIKTDSLGDEIWNKTFGGSNNDYAYSVEETTDGGYIITGNTISYGAGYDDVWLIKTDANGNEIWNKTFGGSGTDVGYSVQQTLDGGYILTGYTDSFGVGGYDIWLIKTDTNGNEIWNKTFGDSDDNRGYSVSQTTDEGYVIVGWSGVFAADAYDIWLIKTDADGNKSWDKTFGGKNSDSGRSVRQSNDGGYIITGLTHSYGAGEYDVWLIKTDEDGITSIENEQFTIDICELYQNYPNPFNPETTIQYSLHELSDVKLKVYDLRGSEVCSLVDQLQKKGQHNVDFIGSELTSGIYFYSLIVNDIVVDCKKMILLK